MTARLRTSPSLWPLRARAWLVAIGGPALWLGLLLLAHALAGHACDLLARLRLCVLVALGASACGLGAVLGQGLLKRDARRDPDARYLLVMSGTLHLMCALSLFAQLIPILLGVTCR